MQLFANGSGFFYKSGAIYYGSSTSYGDICNFYPSKQKVRTQTGRKTSNEIINIVAKNIEKLTHLNCQNNIYPKYPKFYVDNRSGWLNFSVSLETICIIQTL